MSKPSSRCPRASSSCAAIWPRPAARARRSRRARLHQPRGAHRRHRLLPQAAGDDPEREQPHLLAHLRGRGAAQHRAHDLRLVVDGVRVGDHVPEPRGRAAAIMPPPFTAYGFSKLIGEWYCRAFYDQYGLPYTILPAVQRHRPRGRGGRRGRRRARHPRPGEEDPRRPASASSCSATASRRAASRTCATSRAASSWRSRAGSAVNEDFNLGNAEEITMLELARRIYEPSRRRRKPFEAKYVPGFSVRREAAACPTAEGEAPARLGAADRLRRRPARGHRASACTR